ncbi:roundabout homolog 2-like [Dermacentor silvarum]|uniref:roundabout homolog 2-like n=1 Tax=Dermacentor silvarum TaxID=543639 RepID=UPI002101C073|nr:roundabout homolog 2-like [Dermacentor silvarum]
MPRDGRHLPTSSQGGRGGRAPRITEQPVDVVVRKHEPVTLRCGADGDPPPRITWFHDGKTVRDSATRMVLPEGQLFFLQVQHSRREQDTGLYWCTAANALGTARSRNASVELADEVQLRGHSFIYFYLLESTAES